MKITLLVLFTMVVCSLRMQAQDKVFLNVYLVHTEDTAKAIFLKSLRVTLRGDTPRVVEAKRLRGNSYEIKLDRALFPLIGFTSDRYGFSLRCVDNRKSQLRKETLEVYLDDSDVDYSTLDPLPPCKIPVETD